MENKCPNCGRKLSIFYVKQECDKCGCNLLYYDMENRMEEDAKQAKQEYDRLYALINRILGPLIRHQQKQEAKKQAKNGGKQEKTTEETPSE